MILRIFYRCCNFKSSCYYTKCTSTTTESVEHIPILSLCRARTGNSDSAAASSTSFTFASILQRMSEEVANKKPSPDIYQLACERLGRSPDECVAVEDSAIGLQAARSAGIDVVVTVNADTRHQDFSQALLVVDQLGEPGEPCTLLAASKAAPRSKPMHVDLALIRQLMAAQHPHTD